MATTKTTINLTNPTARGKLIARREPYWTKIQAGLYLGFRRSVDKGGYWIGRRAGEGETRYEYLNIGSDQDSAEAAGIEHTSALAKVNEWNTERLRGISDGSETVSDICRVYVEWLRISEKRGPKSAYDAEKRFERLVYNAPIGKTRFKDLKEIQVLKWRAALVEDDYEDDEEKARKQDSANRNFKSFRAALNYGVKKKYRSDADAWKSIELIPDVGASREDFLGAAQRKAFIGAMPEDLQKLATALLMTGARPGEMAKAQIAHFDKDAGILKLKGKTKKWRDVYLSDTARAFIAENAKGKIGRAFIFTRADGEQWQAHMWCSIIRQKFRPASEENKKGEGLAAKLGLPLNIVMYHLRHAYISESLAQGIDVFTVARLCGTSVEMIQKHYHKFIPSNIQERLSKVAII
ncbi:MAG TPA: tyrosine-type recombinase/integrase [Paraburkholderia sp.]|jgi:integrase|uniref:tyrosine-type recombinase/integrase n=1 Tax=Paraburkholderia sp. TaxID=1926495 RepID=UPI002DEF983D|nr:tyrosine-type recombinase/integrase [Paraburkholderia sp.]